MAKHAVTLIPGDGIGTETSAAMRRVVETIAADVRKATGSSQPAASCTEFTDALVTALDA